MSDHRAIRLPGTDAARIEAQAVVIAAASAASPPEDTACPAVRFLIVTQTLDVIMGHAITNWLVSEVPYRWLRLHHDLWLVGLPNTSTKTAMQLYSDLLERARIPADEKIFVCRLDPPRSFSGRMDAGHCEYLKATRLFGLHT